MNEMEFNLRQSLLFDLDTLCKLLEKKKKEKKKKEAVEKMV